MSKRYPSEGDRPLPTQPPSVKIVILSAGYTLFFLVLLFLAYRGTLPVGRLTNFHNADKLGHLILYCIPSYLGHCLCRRKHYKIGGPQRLSIPVFPGLFTLFTVTEELVQGMSPNRTLDAGDMVCSLIGIAVGYWLAQRQSEALGASRRESARD
ncbi:MAG: hypothetical protein AAFN12_06275 [Cyanobacteria bacterium J06560_2]